MTMRIRARRWRDHLQGLPQCAPHGPEGLALVRRQAPESMLGHGERREPGQSEVHGPSNEERQTAIQTGQRDGQRRTHQTSNKAGLRASHQRLWQTLRTDFVGQPGGSGPATKRYPESPHDLGGKHRGKYRDGPLEDEADAGKSQPDHNREAAAVDVGDDTSGDLKGELGYFDGGADQDELEGVEADDFDLIDEAGGDDGQEGKPLDSRHANGEWVGGEPLHWSVVLVRRSLADEGRIARKYTEWASCFDDSMDCGGGRHESQPQPDAVNLQSP